jgi:hypothetical protein
MIWAHIDLFIYMFFFHQTLRQLWFSLDPSALLILKYLTYFISFMIVFFFHLWQQYLLEKRAVIDNDGGKLLNEDNDIRSVSSYSLTLLMFYVLIIQRLNFVCCALR